MPPAPLPFTSFTWWLTRARARSSPVLTGAHCHPHAHPQPHTPLASRLLQWQWQCECRSFVDRLVTTAFRAAHVWCAERGRAERRRAAVGRHAGARRRGGAPAQSAPARTYAARYCSLVSRAAQATVSPAPRARLVCYVQTRRCRSSSSS